MNTTIEYQQPQTSEFIEILSSSITDKEGLSLIYLPDQLSCGVVTDGVSGYDSTHLNFKSDNHRRNISTVAEVNELFFGDLSGKNSDILLKKSKMPDWLTYIINEYQTAYQKAKGRKISKESVIYMMVGFGCDELENKTKALKTLID